MTGYHIRIGYNSHLNSAGKDEAFTTLKAVVAALREDTDGIVAEVKRERDGDRALIQEYAKVYRLSMRDSTLTVREPDGDKPGEIMQLASGGGEGREMKERLRRAFSRLVIFEMHRRGIEVNLVVA